MKKFLIFLIGFILLDCAKTKTIQVPIEIEEFYSSYNEAWSNGDFNFIFWLSFKDISVSAGKTFEKRGNNKTSSNVNACLNGGRLLTTTPVLRILKLLFECCLIKLAW